MKYVLLLTAALVISMPSAHSKCICLTDGTCSETSDCLNSGDCTSTTFAVSTACTYVLKVVSKCTGGVSCRYCMSCATVYKSGNPSPVIHAHTTGCDNGDCDYEATGFFDIGTNYTLYVCKSYCPGETGDCEECQDDEVCKASACVYESGSVSCSP